MAWYLVKQVFPPCSVQEAIFGLLHFHVNFRIGLSVSYAHKKKPVRILIRIVLNLWISLERTDFFMILRLLIYDWNTSPYIWDLQCLTINYNMLHVSLGEGSGNPLQCSCLENPRDGGASWAAVYGVAQSRTLLKQLSSSSSIWVLLIFCYIYTFIFDILHSIASDNF